MIRRYLPRSTEQLIQWYERYIAPLSLIAGFLLDNYILLRRVDLLESNLLLISYLTIAALGIVLINLIESGRWRYPWVLSVAPFIPVVVQFCFGGLFSGFLSLYSRSAAYATSWIFVIALAALLLGNERFRKLYVRFSFQITIYFTVLFSFLIFFLPVVFKAIGPWMFVVSGFSSLVFIALLLVLLRRIVPEIVKKNITTVARSIATIFVLFNVLYFTDVIPPLPLSLKDAGVYHSVTRVGGEYHLLGEKRPWWQIYLTYNTTVHLAPGESAYVFTAVFAPSGLSTVILHQWQRYDASAGQWATADTVRFPVSGGRDGGYRGYSIKSDLTPGKWRVNVLTQYGQLIGRVGFDVVSVSSTPQLTETVF